MPAESPIDIATGPAGMIRQQQAWHHIVVGDYTARVFVREWLPASGDGRLLIALHGLTASGLDFEYLAQNLAAAGWRVVCPDLPGHGRSSQFGTPDAYGLSKLTRFMDVIFDIYRKPGEPVSVLGASWGGGALTLFLAARQIEIDALIVNDVALEFDPYLDRYVSFLRTESKRRFETATLAHLQLISRNKVLFLQNDDRKIDPRVMKKYLNSRIVRGAKGFRFNYDPAFMSGRLGNENYPDYFKAISAIKARRIMLMFGARSPFRNLPVVERLLRECNNVTYCEIEDAGHAPRLLTPGEIGIVRGFLEGECDVPAAS